MVAYQDRIDASYLMLRNRLSPKLSINWLALAISNRNVIFMSCKNSSSCSNREEIEQQ